MCVFKLIKFKNSKFCFVFKDCHNIILIIDIVKKQFWFFQWYYISLGGLLSAFCRYIMYDVVVLNTSEARINTTGPVSHLHSTCI